MTKQIFKKQKVKMPIIIIMGKLIANNVSVRNGKICMLNKVNNHIVYQRKQLSFNSIFQSWNLSINYNVNKWTLF